MSSTSTTTSTTATATAAISDPSPSTTLSPATPTSQPQMRAVRFHGINDIRYESLAVPVCGAHQIKVRPAWCGICGTDVHEYLTGVNLCPTTPHPITGETVPLVFGHEFSGIIEEVGSAATARGLRVGDRVAVQPIIYDGTCGACRDGLINCCDKNGFVGLSGWGGGLSEHVVVPEYAVYKIPGSVGLDVAALVEPLAVGWHAVNASPFQPTDTCLVLGGGPIGLAVVQALRARGCPQIIVSEISSMRKQFASDFGAHVVLDPRHDDVVSECRGLTAGRGVDVTFDAAGVPAGMDTGIGATRARGMVVNIAIWDKKYALWPNDFNFKERKYMGVATYQEGDFEEVIRAIADGRLDKARRMITKRIEMGEVVEEGFRALVEDKDNQVKILVRGSGEV